MTGHQIMKKLKVIDFFCGAGGFSEGFRQQGFEIIKGIDNWKPAVETHNLNHGLNDEVMDVLTFEGEQGIVAIKELPDTEIIIGSPPCVTFSMSNKAGKADKSLGVRLIEAYLRAIAVKKHQPGSILKAWLMENVPNSRNYVKDVYSFTDLNLGDWAETIGRSPSDEALKAKNNGRILIAADYGSPQSRQRFVCGEIVATGKFLEPKWTHGPHKDIFDHKAYPTLGDIKNKMPSPTEFKEDAEWTDPNYPSLKVKGKELTDHFYDSGVYQVEWEMARFAKVNHPYMGRMSFPEDPNKPSRTIMATRSASTREAIIFESELGRTGDGQYRLPTIREAATLMGFPYTYQFLGGEGTKWRLIGNAVCSHMAAALAKEIRSRIGLRPIADDKVNFSEQRKHYRKVNDLNDPGQQIVFNAPPKKKNGAKFRMHPFKAGNMTVALTNFDPNQGSDYDTNGMEWYCAIFLGAGKEYGTVSVGPEMFAKVNELVRRLPDGKGFIKEYNASFKGRIADKKMLQSILEQNKAKEGKVLGPITLIEEIAELIKKYDSNTELLGNVVLDGIHKELFPKRQLLAIWAIAKAIKIPEKIIS
jgi:DNA (cytosine-5)-methyltransferase 1